MTIETPTIPEPKWKSAFTPAVELGKPKSIFLYGTHGTRKTSIASSIAKVRGFNKTLHIDIDNGTEVLANDPTIIALIETGKYNILPINPLEPGALTKIDSVITDITTVDYGYDAVIFDTFDVGQDVSERNAEVKYATSGKGGTRDGFAVYREVGEWSDVTMRKLHDSKFFTGIVVAHEKEGTLDDGTVRTTPRLSGSSKDEIGGIPSIVAYLQWRNHPETGEKHLVWNLGESAKTVTKNRFNLPDQILDADMPALFDLIEKNRPKKSATTAASK